MNCEYRDCGNEAVVATQLKNKKYLYCRNHYDKLQEFRENDDSNGLILFEIYSSHKDENLIRDYDEEEDYDRVSFGFQRPPEGFVIFSNPDNYYFYCTETEESVVFCNRWMAFRAAWAYYREIKNEKLY